ncbi:unnamed protein product [Coregonus sp. 'balchen']|nr:unnamed protein product [Coregonus sp. 'balchen']
MGDVEESITGVTCASVIMTVSLTMSAVWTTNPSDACKGRCGESFKRGRLCDCDPDCARYNKCCPDYNSQCGIEDNTKKTGSTATLKTSSCNNINDD